VFPLMLAPVYAVFGLDLMPMKWVGILSFLGALVLTALLFRRFLSPLYLGVLLALLGLNPYFWRLKDAVLSDLPFFFFTYLALYLLQHQPDLDRPRSRTALHAVAFGAACYLAYGTREPRRGADSVRDSRGAGVATADLLVEAVSPRSSSSRSPRSRRRCRTGTVGTPRS
jgi:hypothetical protein